MRVQVPVRTHARYCEVFSWSYSTVTELDVIQSYVTLRYVKVDMGFKLKRLTLKMSCRYLIAGPNPDPNPEPNHGYRDGS